MLRSNKCNAPMIWPAQHKPAWYTLGIVMGLAWSLYTCKSPSSPSPTAQECARSIDTFEHCGVDLRNAHQPSKLAGLGVMHTHEDAMRQLLCVSVQLAGLKQHTTAVEAEVLRLGSEVEQAQARITFLSQHPTGSSALSSPQVRCLH